MTTEKKYDQMKLIVIAILAINILLAVYIAFFKRDALWLETMKAGWTANMNMAKQLYKSPVYIQQQKATLDQILDSMNQVAPTDTTTPTVQPEATPTTETIPTVTQ